MKRILTTKTLTLGLILLVASTTLVGCGSDDKKKSGGNIYTNRDGAAGARTDTGAAPGSYGPGDCQGNPAAVTDAMACLAGRAMNVGDGVQFKKFLSADLPTNDPSKVGMIQAAGLWLKVSIPTPSGSLALVPAGQSVNFGSPGTVPVDANANHIRIVVWDSLVGQTKPSGGTFQPIQIDLPAAQPSGETRISGVIGMLVGGTRSFSLNYQDRYGTVNILGNITGTQPALLNITSVAFQNILNANQGANPESGNLGGTLSGLGIGPSILP